MSDQNAEKKIAQSINILLRLGLPKEQQNERSALTLLSLLDIKGSTSWSEASSPMLGIKPMMDWFEEHYGKKYAPNTRETIRRQTLHQFCEAGVALYNPDDPDRAVNSPKACYQIAPDALKLIRLYLSSEWEAKLAVWLSERSTLVQRYAMERNKSLIPPTISDGNEIHLSPGAHSGLIKDIVTEFGPRFLGGAKVLYLGDTGAKEDFFDTEALKILGIVVDRKGKLPDVVMYQEAKNWLVLIEAVTSHGPIDGKRYIELTKLFEKCAADLVFVTAFPDRSTMTRFSAQVSWETEVWIADSPEHMIHYNGDKFLGPYTQ